MSFEHHDIASIPAEKRAKPVTSSTEALARVREGLAVAEDQVTIGAGKSAAATLSVVRSYQSLATTLTRREDDELRDFCTKLVAIRNDLGDAFGLPPSDDIALAIAEILGIEVPS